MKLVQLIILVLLPTFIFGQDFGFFGKKNVVAVNGLFNMPLIYLFADRGTIAYKPNSTGKLIEKNNLIDLGMNVSFSHAFSGKFALGFEYGLNYSKCNGPSYANIVYDEYDNYSIYADIKHEQLSLRTMTYMPKIEFSMLGNQLPFGINNQVGFGFTTTKILDKEYVAEINDLYYNDPYIVAAFDPKKVLDPDRKSLKGFTIMYGFNVRTPINKHLLINYGIRYTLNATIKYNVLGGTNYNYSDYDLNGELPDLVARKRLTSVLALNIGINYIF